MTIVHLKNLTKSETPGAVARARIYVKINAYLFEGTMSPASWGYGQGFGDRRDLLRVQAGPLLNLNPEYLNS
jgi:hypothetical protein